ncbi:hypothetical protein PIB30_018606 [Stylosanthes scabra]|uniref:Uncharacterized protein n=1 Tax=Stylosanthes scabra TaxID=79078 RepID=A0ABU6S8C7_9FABA|nr:hypothetical protein [Stylosanthes scabra]
MISSVGRVSVKLMKLSRMDFSGISATRLNPFGMIVGPLWVFPSFSSVFSLPLLLILIVVRIGGMPILRNTLLGKIKIPIWLSLLDALSTALFQQTRHLATSELSHSQTWNPGAPPLPPPNPSLYLSFFVAAAPPTLPEVHCHCTSIVSVASMLSSTIVRHFQQPSCRSVPRSEGKTASTLLRAPVTGFVALSTFCDVSSALTTASKFGSGGSGCDRFTLAFAGSRHVSVHPLSFAAVVPFSALFPPLLMALLLTPSSTSPSFGSVAL